MLDRIDRLTVGIAALTEIIEQLLALYEEQLQQAESMPCWGGAPPRTPSPKPART
jgi:hypothetical protein